MGARPHKPSNGQKVSFMGSNIGIKFSLISLACLVAAFIIQVKRDRTQRRMWENLEKRSLFKVE